mgnify:FL=1
MVRVPRAIVRRKSPSGAVRRTRLPLVILIDLLGEESSDMGEVVFTGLKVRNEHIG